MKKLIVLVVVVVAGVGVWIHQNNSKEAKPTAQFEQIPATQPPNPNQQNAPGQATQPKDITFNAKWGESDSAAQKTYLTSPEYQAIQQIETQYAQAAQLMPKSEAETLYVPRIIETYKKAIAAHPEADTRKLEFKLAVSWMRKKVSYDKYKVIEQCEAYLRKYPNDMFATIVKATIEDCKQGRRIVQDSNTQ